MTNQTSFSLVASGSPITIPNFLQNSSSLTVTYTPSGMAGSLAITVAGVVAATGDSVVLDTFSGTSGTTRSISLAGVTYDSYQIIGVWSGAAQNFFVAATLSSTGAGATYNSGTLPTIHAIS